jgi:hypothetical protein
MHFFLGKVGYRKDYGYVNVADYNKPPFSWARHERALARAYRRNWKQLTRPVKWKPNMGDTERKPTEAILCY